MDVLIYCTWRGQKLLCIMKKIMSQVKPSLVTDVRYETKVGFLFIVGEATGLAPRPGFSGGRGR